VVETGGQGELDRAIVDYNEARRLDPKSVLLTATVASPNLFHNEPARALADLSHAAELDPKQAHTALWRDIAGARNRAASRLAQAVSRIDMTVWPAPVIRLFLGQLTPAAVLAAADSALILTGLPSKRPARPSPRSPERCTTSGSTGMGHG